MTYKGYEGVVSFDEEAEILHGEVVGTRDVITFQGKSIAEVTRAFRESVDDYLSFCKQKGKNPDKPYSGRLLVRVSPEMHRKLAAEAAREKISLNTYIESRLS